MASTYTGDHTYGRRGFTHGPGLVLLCLLAMGVALAGVIWGVHWKNVARMAAEDTEDPWLSQQNELLRRQNERLIEEIWRLHEPNQRQERWRRPVEIEEAVARVWGSGFAQDPVYRLVHPHDLAMLRQRDLNHWLDDRTFEALALFLGMVGLSEPHVNLQQTWTVLSEASTPIEYDHESRAILVDPTLDPASPEARRGIGAALAVMRMDEDGRVAKLLADGARSQSDFDRGLAIRVHIFGLAAYLGDLADQQVSGKAADPLPFAGPPADDAQGWMEAPDVIRQLHAYPDLEGASWWAELDEKSGRVEMLRQWREEDPPKGTHRYLAIGEKQGGAAQASFSREDEIVHQWGTTLGPLMFQFLVFESLGLDAAEQAVQGWKADAFQLGAMADGGLKAVWQTDWQDQDAALAAGGLLENLAAALPERVEATVRHPGKADSEPVGNNQTIFQLNVSGGP